LHKVNVKTLNNIHTSEILFLKYLSESNDFYVASSSNDNSVNIWDIKTGVSVRIYKEHTDKVYSLDEINDDVLVSGSKDGYIRIWKISTGETLNKFYVEHSVNIVKVLQKSQLIVCGVRNNLRIYNLSKNVMVKSLSGHDSNIIIYTIEILNEQFIASGGSDRNITIWDLTTDSIKYKLVGHEGTIFCIKRLSSYLIASADSFAGIKIWNWILGEHVNTLIGHTRAVTYLDLFDIYTLISVSWDKTIKLWNISNGSLLQTINTETKINALTMLKTSKIFNFSDINIFSKW